MEFQGRIIGILFSFINSSAWAFYGYYTFGVFYTKVFIFFLLLFTFLFWQAGRLYDEAKFHSEKDSLTNTYNRRFIYKKFSKFIAKCNKCSAYIIDIDNFKQINDIYGHLIGDKVICAVSSVLLNQINKSDILARWGGDEFLLLSSHIQTKEEFEFNVQKNMKIISKQMGFEINVSIGCSTYPYEGLSLEELIKVADNNMYSNKASKQLPQEMLTNT
ncbi:GGDEF domain-containing protein [Mesobacillus subterraneus]|uniref:GGDEF domain-containing protein n=1 Tax=Mesobacillus subterraneus TaxID=285983 RepID=UPI00203CFF38|nr:GGDEF domain-containing protein [Mesobacillus subterraneus]MCM3574722.1 GGDEF domain-containing protein [Mesobacillus subterraneus]